jgi:hypothetical protein
LKISSETLALAKKIFKSKNRDFLEKVFSEARSLADKNFGKKINFYFTSNFFPPISVTGTGCALNCLHCQHKLLEMMVPAKTPKDLMKQCLSFWGMGVKGILLSGGCQSDFTVPLEKFTKTIREIKKKTGLFILAHTGLLAFEKAKKLVDCGVDGVALDVVGSSETTRKVYGVKIEKKKFVESLISAKKAGFKVISPHVCVGLHFGKLKGELEALKIIGSIKPTTVVITVLMPLPGTPMGDFLVNPLDVAKIVAAAKLLFPDVPVTLGCARSKGRVKEEIEKLSVKAGVTSIAMPTKKTYETVKKSGFKVEFYGACCAVPPQPRFRLKKTVLSKSGFQ